MLFPVIFRVLKSYQNIVVITFIKSFVVISFVRFIGSFVLFDYVAEIWPDYFQLILFIQLLH